MATLAFTYYHSSSVGSYGNADYDKCIVKFPSNPISSHLVSYLGIPYPVATSYVPHLCLFLLAPASCSSSTCTEQSSATSKEGEIRQRDVVGICMFMYEDVCSVVFFCNNTAELFCETDDHPIHSLAGHACPPLHFHSSHPQKFTSALHTIPSIHPILSFPPYPCMPHQNTTTVVASEFILDFEPGEYLLFV